MNSDPLFFLDEPSIQQTEVVSKQDPLSFLDARPNRTKSKNLNESFEELINSKPPKGRNIFADALTTGTAIAGVPGDLASLFIGENALTSKSLREKAFELAPSLAPKDDREKEWDEDLSTLMGLIAPTGGPLKAATGLIGKGLSKATPKFLKGKYLELYEKGKNLGISEKALAPFKHGKVSETFLKSLSKLGKEAKEGVEFAQKLASPMYNEIYTQASKIPLNETAKRGVIRGFGNIIKEIEKSPALVKESKDVVNFLQEASEALKINPDVTVENLMALQKQLGKTVNWRSIKQSGKAHLVGEAKEAVMKGIYGMNPSLGKKFSDMDKLYAGYEKLAKEVSPYKLLNFADKGGPIGYALLSLVTGHDLGESLKTGLGTFFGKKALGKISGKLLTDPKWVSLKEKVLKIIKDESADKIPKILVALKKKSDSESLEKSKD